MGDKEIAICRLADVTGGGKAAAQMDAIFFAASAVPISSCPAARAAFRERWLGRYLAHYPGEIFLARGPDGHIVGYLAGCLADPAREKLFEDISYFADFAEFTREFPAHLHVNLKAAFRNCGIGAKLIETFAAHVAAAGVRGMHVVTGERARSVAFYRRCGFEPQAWTEWNGKRIVLLGRPLT
jgi:GNAT superfamily N-acetyltransferase